MSSKEIISSFSAHKEIQSAINDLSTYSGVKILADGLKGSMKALFGAIIYNQLNKNIVFILNDQEEALYFLNDLETFIHNKKIYFFPSSFKNDDPQILYNTGILQRTEVLNALSKKINTGHIVVTYSEALCENVLSPETISSNVLSLKSETELDIDFLIDYLNEYEFEAVEYVYEAGCYAIRGGIIDIFSFSNPLPYRIELVGDKIESIREFDPENQLSTRNIDHFTIIPNLEKTHLTKKIIPFHEYIQGDTILFFNNLGLIKDSIKNFNKKIKKVFSHDNNSNYFPELLNENHFPDEMNSFSSVQFSYSDFFTFDNKIKFDVSPQPSFNRNFKLLVDDLVENQKKHYTNYIFSDSSKQIERLYAIFEDINPEISFRPVYENLQSGFVDHHLKIACYTEHEIFVRYHKYKQAKAYSKDKALSLRELYELKPGDYVTHINYGIGRFSGLEKIDISGKKQEAIRLEYKDGDLLYVSIHSMHKIARYTGREGTVPKLHKLGSKAWENLKNKTKSRIKDIARDLIKLYAKRKTTKGFEFSPDTYLQTELEASFIYEDTPDQAKATEEVKMDMERQYPMDRLICGDVGYGKTEIAIRAAFKAVADSTQVAVLVPTTILAFQHYKTFRERLKDFPCNVEYLSRFKSARQQIEIVKKLAEAKIDIIIGTHKLLGKEIKFKNLGLLIVDEEQKFGVSAKERLRQLKVNVDTLTLTATPIPRTLQFSLMGVRDLSLINTPPLNRQAIDTFIKPFDEVVIRECIEKELNRGGQVFFVHNRISDLSKVANIVKRLVPHAKIGVAHGQMEGHELEETMLNFIDGYYDILVSTNIIESGLDIPNANTIIIDNAHFFGLSDLYQMRGRVGRSNIKAYCYMIIPSFGEITADARKRLAAIEEFSELGSGLHIALRDLDIRGAGNLLGAEQSGFISDIGLEMYKKILDEALSELKQEEFTEFFNEKEDVQLFSESVIDTDLEVLIPDEYINNIEERLILYNKLNRIQDEKNLKLFEQELTDRFGPLPWQTNDLLDLIRLKWVSTKLGSEKIVLKNRTLKVFFPYIYSKNEKFSNQIFIKVLNYAKTHPNTCRFQEKPSGLELVLKPIVFIDEALSALTEMNRMQ